MGRAAARRPARPAAKVPAKPAVTERVGAAASWSANLRELRDNGEARRALAVREAELVEQLRGQDVSWRQIGDALGTTPQAAQQRFGQLR